MSDFDDVLERLITDPAFQTALRANPDAALAGYRLQPDERRLLAVQLDGHTGEERTVELRISKSGVMGMVGPVVSAMGLAGGPASPSGTGVFGLAPRDEGTFDPGTPEQSFGEMPVTQVFGTTGPGPGGGSFTPPEAVGYHTYVDVDGDGTWDANTAYERPDGGVDIHVDVNHDGKVDFIGRDYNRDGLVDDADFDTDLDGAMDTRMYDDNGDGWMDRSGPVPGPHADEQTFGQAPAEQAFGQAPAEQTFGQAPAGS